MTEQTNTPEALEVVRAVLERLMSCDRFYGHIREPRETDELRIVYGPGETIEWHYGKEEIADIKFEDGKLFLREGSSEAPWEEETEPPESAGLMQFSANICDPRKVLANLEDVFVGPFGTDQRVIRAFLNVRALIPQVGLAEDLITHIEHGLQVPRPQDMDVDTYSKLQRPGNLRPMVEFFIDQNNLPLSMTVGRILPGDEDSFTIEFSYWH